MSLLRRYQSEIYGNYRLAYTQYGLVAGALMALYFLFFSIIGKPHATPTTYGTDLLLLIVILVGAYRYRKSLPEGKVSFKELMLLGLGTGFVAAVVYGLYIYLHLSVIYPDQVTLMCDNEVAMIRENCTEAMSGEVATCQQKIDIVASFGAGAWAFRGGFLSGVFSILMAFIAALLFKTEMKRKPKQS